MDLVIVLLHKCPLNLMYNYVIFKQILKDIRAERTSGSIEAWNYIVKQVDHAKSRIRPDLFFKEHFPILRGRHM